MSYDSHTNNVMAVGFQCDGNWMYSGSEDGTAKIWDLRVPGCQSEYESCAAVNTVVLYTNQMELISGDQNGNIRVLDLTANSCSCELVPEVDTAVRSDCNVGWELGCSRKQPWNMLCLEFVARDPDHDQL